MSASIGWLAFGIVLAIAEIVAPGFFLVWIGLAAVLTAGVVAMFGLNFAGQALAFAVLAFGSVAIGRALFRQAPIKSDDPLLNDRAGRLIGCVVTAVEPVDATHGRVKVGDSVWSARGVDAVAGTKLRVAAVDGSVLVVEAV